MVRAARSRGWCFTLNNPAEDFGGIYGYLEATYVVVGDEGKQAGATHHHQGYVYFATLKSFTQVKDMLPDGCHIEIAKGNPEQNQRYCSKEELMFEVGDCPVMGKRKDIQRVKAVIQDGGNMVDVIEIATGVQSLKCADALFKYLEPERD